MTDNLTNVGKAGLGWKDSSRKEKNQVASRGFLPGKNGPSHWGQQGQINPVHVYLIAPGPESSRREGLPGLP